MICSPTEPAQLREAASVVSMLPETFGADLIVGMHEGGWAGVQRKEVKDLCVSIDDGRLNEQVAKMQQLERKMLLIEGELEWTNDGEMIGRRFGAKISRERFDGVLWTVQNAGVWVTATRDLAETIRVVQHFEQWCRKPRRRAGTRPAVSGAWGTPDNHDYQVHLLSGLPGVGPELADRIIATCGMPFVWRVGLEELMTVDGIGKKRAEAILGAIRGGDDSR